VEASGQSRLTIGRDPVEQVRHRSSDEFHECIIGEGTSGGRRQAGEDPILRLRAMSADVADTSPCRPRAILSSNARCSCYAQLRCRQEPPQCPRPLFLIVEPWMHRLVAQAVSQRVNAQNAISLSEGRRNTGSSTLSLSPKTPSRTIRSILGLLWTIRSISSRLPAVKRTEAARRYAQRSMTRAAWTPGIWKSAARSRLSQVSNSFRSRLGKPQRNRNELGETTVNKTGRERPQPQERSIT